MTENHVACQQCKKEFAHDAADLDFYRMMQVPPPTFCPSCRFRRRLMFVNEMTLYKRACALCGKEVPSMFAPEKPYVVYCNPCWQSDRWDPTDYAMEYDPARNFFDQFRELQHKAPVPALLGYLPSLINSAYTNYSGEMKDSYLVFDSYGDDNCYDAWMSDRNRDLMDGLLSNANELVSHAVNCDLNNRTHFSENTEACHDVYFSRNVVGANDCFGCVNLKNASYSIFNTPYAPDDYKKKLQEFRLSSYASVERLKQEIRAFWLRHPQRDRIGQQNENVSGEYIYNSKNVHDGYVVYGAENCRRVQLLTELGTTESQDSTKGGGGASRMYECIMTGGGMYQVRFSVDCWADKTSNIEYSRLMISAADCFGCIGINKKQYCILNKRYSKEDYEKLRAQIIADMTARPYQDAKGRLFGYGEFFPYDCSYFDYNETTAQVFFPSDAQTVRANGWTWREAAPVAHAVTKRPEELPDDITDTPDSIVDEVVACATCGRAYRIVPGELRLLRMWKLPLPRQCFWCRNAERVRSLRPFESFSRTCSRCGKAIVSSISPARPDIVYCEECYLAEVV